MRLGVRASLWLVLAVLAAFIGLVALAAWQGAPRWITIGGGLLALALVVGDKVDLGISSVPDFVAARLAARDRRKGRPPVSVWYVDLDYEAERQRAERNRAFLDDTEDNPTIR